MDKVIYVVGMGSGVSLAVGRRFARDGYAVGAIARDADKLERVLGTLRESGVQATAAITDAGNTESLRAALAQLQSELGDAHVLVYNAAGVTHRPLDELAAEQLAADLQVSVAGARTATQHVLPAMRARRSGTVLLTSGGFALEPTPEMASLGIGKAGIRNLAFSLHADLKDSGVHAATVTICGGVAPGTAFDPDHIAKAYWQLHSQPDTIGGRVNPEDLTASAPGKRSKDLLTPVEATAQAPNPGASGPSWSLPRAFEFPSAACGRNQVVPVVSVVRWE